jgi:nucleotide-binding universal stress UspA family protein
MFKKILIANDGSEAAFKALLVALRLARSHEAQAHMVCVEEPSWMGITPHDEVVGDKATVDSKFADVVAKAQAEAKLHGLNLVSHILIGHPAPIIIDFIVQEGFDLLATGFKSHSALYHKILGKTTDRLVELAPCAVLVVK